MACRASVAADSASALCLRWESTASAAASYWQAGKQSRRTPRDRSCGSRFRASLPTCPTFKRTKLDYSIVAHTVAWPNGVAKSESGRPRPRASRGRSARDGVAYRVPVTAWDYVAVAHLKRKGPKSTRAGCLLCKPHKHQAERHHYRSQQRRHWRQHEAAASSDGYRDRS